ncbi:hypothetical protein P171DRAFT_446867 [Karstenula rhodostoma CBS 690.94]|uniref:Probable double zinc ribbon domain-containing protein n=1 Tax=Karstenula rhodostoma CBS 690.94 TaxID=1392251 RepID=A0A9P4U878_9PLEO|nr:hypothetical protein P171DRAFT_446867 [Karstenula rhodostoma CBS 690.94]
MPYHDLSLARGLVAKHLQDLKTQTKSLFKRKDRPLDLPPSEPDYNTAPPSHWMGWWICSNCNEWAYPQHRLGPHPYGNLRCLNPDCKAVISPAAITSPALHRVTIVTPAQSFVPVACLAGAHREQIPYFTVCPCGLTHRARLYKQSLYRKWKHFPSSQQDESVIDKFRRFLKHKDKGDATLIEFEHVQCNKCYRKYDVHRWQHFAIYHDAVFHIDGRDEHGRWAEVRHKE